MSGTTIAKSDNKVSFSTVTRYFRKYRRYLIAGGIAVLGTNVLFLYVPFLTKEIFDSLETGVDPIVLRNQVLTILGLAVAAGFFRFVMRRTIIWMSRYIEYDLRNDLMSHLLKLDSSFYHNSRTGDTMARMTNDLEAVRQMVGPGVMYISDSIIKLLISFTVMIYLSPLLTLYAAVPLIILPIGVNLIGNKMHKRSMKIQTHFSTLSAATQENLSGIRVVKAYGQEEEEVKNFEKLSEKYIELNMSLAKLQGVFFPVMRITAQLSYLSVFFFGGLAIINGSATLGTLVAFFGYLSIILWPVIALGWVVSLYQRGTASLMRINKVLETSSQTVNVDEPVIDKKIKGIIEFRDLTFSYNNDSDPVLKNINLTVNAGQTLGVVGPTGSGKTTLVSLLPRLFKVQRDQLFIDGVDINDWDLKTIRSQIGFATQEPFLFSDSIKNNIMFGVDSGADDESKMRNGAETAALKKDVEDFSEKFETVVGERGITLSGGQKQRTAIARAIVIDPSIIILDDATSAVDTETEHEINHRIKDVLNGRTSIIISHRISAIKDADIILYLQDGQIVEQGTHEELLKLERNYATLHRSQLMAMELDSL